MPPTAHAPRSPSEDHAEDHSMNPSEDAPDPRHPDHADHADRADQAFDAVDADHAEPMVDPIANPVLDPIAHPVMDDLADPDAFVAGPFRPVYSEPVSSPMFAPDFSSTPDHTEVPESSESSESLESSEASESAVADESDNPDDWAQGLFAAGDAAGDEEAVPVVDDAAVIPATETELPIGSEPVDKYAWVDTDEDETDGQAEEWPTGFAGEDTAVEESPVEEEAPEPEPAVREPAFEWTIRRGAGYGETDARTDGTDDAEDARTRAAVSFGDPATASLAEDEESKPEPVIEPEVTDEQNAGYRTPGFQPETVDTAEPVTTPATESENDEDEPRSINLFRADDIPAFFARRGGNANEIEDHDETEEHEDSEDLDDDRAPVRQARTDEFSVRPAVPLHGFVAGGAGLLAILFAVAAGRADGFGAVWRWVFALGFAVLAGLAIRALASKPTLVADRTGIRLRMTREWIGAPWEEIEAVTVLPRRHLLDDGRIAIHLSDPGPVVAAIARDANRATRTLTDTNRRLTGSSLAVPFGLAATPSNTAVVSALTTLADDRCTVTEQP